MTATVLQAKGITKEFPGVLANDHVDFDLREGEIHALLGENGAGKSTLMNIIYGLYNQDEGEIIINGQPSNITTPNDAIEYGIGMVHQHFMLIPVFRVTENIMLGAETLHRDKNRTPPFWKRGIFEWVRQLDFLERRAVTKKVSELSHQYGLDIDPDAIVGDLPVGVQQRVEIIKALYRNAKILILDEPSAVLTPQEVEDLFRIMRELTSRGVSIIFITHKLKEVLAVADRITVMRAGKVVDTVIPEESNEQKLASLMVGRDVLLKVDKKTAHPKGDVLTVSDLRVVDHRKLDVVRGVSFNVRRGEILGIAGVQGNGQTELIEALTGLRPTRSGKVILAGKDVTGKPPRVVTEAGLGHIPEDRQRHGLVLSYPITDNIMLCTYYLPPFAKGFTIQQKAVDEVTRQLIKAFDVRTPSPFVITSKLSGGNQQKVIVARELSRPVNLLIANQPTRGLDVGSIEYIHKEIIAMRDRGVGVLLVSAELDEILSLSDRIAVIYRGEIVTTVDAKDATREQLGLWMAGAKPESA
ncbi:MAG: ABC transporter ATP-binding protein [Chloroflexi bacterium]|nr:ABC transporter ATP-binding protein [Chloroflexota bacterium]